MFRHQHADIAWGLKEALPFVRLFRKRIFVIKAGGEVFTSADALSALVEQISLLHELGMRVVLVHGGGPQTSDLSRRLGIEPRMHGGRRVTSPETLEVCKMTLNGQLATDIVASLTAAGVPACRVSGIDAGLIRATPRAGGDIEWGEVGDIVDVQPHVLEAMLERELVPVLSPLCSDGRGRVLNVNADTVAAATATALGAAKLILLTSVPGILERLEDHGSLLSYLDLQDLSELEENGVIDGGMLPKLAAVRAALIGGVERVHVVSYLVEDSLLLEVFTNGGCGTLIEKEKKSAVPKKENAQLEASS